MGIQRIETDRAPAAIGPYSQAVVSDGWVWCSGQIPIDPATGEIAGTTAAEQAELVLQNLAAVLEAAGAGLGSVVKATVFLADMDDFAKVNEVYAAAFGDHRPARAAVEVARLPKDVRVEIDAVARVDG